MTHIIKSRMLSRRFLRLTISLAVMATGAWILFSDNSPLSRAEAAGFVVTNTNDSGAGSLRQAITDANSNGNGVIDTISFNIPGGGVKSIKPVTPLPKIFTPTTIDGYTQPGASANSMSVGNNATLLIELDGTNAGSAADGLYFAADNSTLRGIVINRFSQFGVSVDAVNVKVEGNFLGTNPGGSTALGNNTGVNLWSQARNCTIGGLNAGARNLISGNKFVGVAIGAETNTDNLVLGNYIGTNAAGTTALGNANGGVLLMNSFKTTVGGTTVTARNVISGNAGDGIRIGPGGGNNVVQGNHIGVQANGFSPLANTDEGVEVTAAGNLIGGPGAGNTIAFNGRSGVKIANSDTVIGNTISANAIYLNQHLGIDLGFGIPVPNDAQDADTGGNNRQNTPIVTAAIYKPPVDKSGGSTTVSGTIDSAPNTQYQIEFFANGQCDSSGYGEGQTFFAATTVTTDFSGSAKFSITTTILNVADLVTATATDPSGNTSGFSPCTPVTSGPLPTIEILSANYLEGNNGTTPFNFSVMLSAPTNQEVTVQCGTFPGTATPFTDYQPATTLVVFNPGETLKTFTVFVNGDTDIEPADTFFVTMSNPTNAALAKTSASSSIIDDDTPAPKTFRFAITDQSVTEQLGSITTQVVRTGDISGPGSVDYATEDHTAKQKGDFEYAAGTLNFAPGEMVKSITVLVNEDALVEGKELFVIKLSNPVGGSLDVINGTAVEILDDLPESVASPIDDAQSFVHQHYHDFLNREPDAAGLQFWTNQITSCGNDAQCIETKRVNVSAAFFLSIEFQKTGYLLYLLQKESFASIPKYEEFMRGLQELSQGVVVNSPGWEQKLKDNQQQFLEKWTNRPAFKTTYDGMSNAAFVNTLYANAGLLPYPPDITQLVTALDNNFPAQWDPKLGIHVT